MIRYYHIRRKDDDGVLMAKGGMTIAYDTETRNIGCAICSLKDNYWKFKGRKIAESRLRHCPVLAVPAQAHEAIPLSGENMQAAWAHRRLLLFCLTVPIVLAKHSNVAYPIVDLEPMLVKDKYFDTENEGR